MCSIVKWELYAAFQRRKKGKENVRSASKAALIMSVWIRFAVMEIHCFHACVQRKGIRSVLCHPRWIRPRPTCYKAYFSVDFVRRQQQFVTREPPECCPAWFSFPEPKNPGWLCVLYVLPSSHCNCVGRLRCLYCHGKINIYIDFHYRMGPKNPWRLCVYAPYIWNVNNGRFAKGRNANVDDLVLASGKHEVIDKIYSAILFTDFNATYHFFIWFVCSDRE